MQTDIPPDARTGAPLPPSPPVLRGRGVGGEGAFAIEFAGWLPIFREFGNCGRHPQFAHTASPPAGYQFVRSGPADDADWPSDDKEPPKRRGVLALLQSLGTLLANGFRHGPWRCACLLVTVARLVLSLRCRGVSWTAALRFVHSRHFSSQILVPRRPGLLFLTSVPYTYGQHPWLIEIEDSTSLFYPFLRNGQTGSLDLQASPYFVAVRHLLERDNCRAIVTHMRSTAATLPRLFDSSVLVAKTFHVPLGVPLPARWLKHEGDEHLDLLFTCSWHQDPESLYLRGGLEVLDAFDILHARYPQVRLTLRCALPRSLPARYREIIDRCWVRVISWYLQPQEIDALFCKSHVFLLPAARVHIVSVLKAMSFGQVVVASDGWGFDEYLRHEDNGLIVAGRQGKASWMDEATGTLREDYQVMRSSDPEIVERLVQTLSDLAENRRQCRRLGQAARQEVARRYTLDHWNEGLKRVLDQVVGKQS